MSRTSIFAILGLCIVAGILIAGCTQPTAPAQTPATTVQTTAVSTPQATSAGMPNPASMNCGKIGGTTDIKKNADGSEYGMCTFTNGTSCEEWALLRGEGCKAGVTVAPAATTSAMAGMPNPASVNCGKIGGTTDIKKNADGSEYGMCTFTNGTSCEEWALFRGEGCKAGVTVAPAATTSAMAGMPNPASVNCGKIGGTTDIKKSADGSEYGMCTFTNGTSCEEWALFRGEGCKPANLTASK